MGIIFRQSAKNIFTTYLGFVIGAFNVLFLYTSFLNKEQYGLVSYLLSVSNILMPFLTFGVHNTFIKFYFSYTEKEQQDRFVTFLFLLPLGMTLIGTLLTFCFYQSIYQFITKTNHIESHYIWTMFLFSVLMAYFEIFYAWAKVQLRTVEGNLLKEVFPRIIIFILLWGIHLEIIDFQYFIFLLLLTYCIRMLLMAFISFRIKKPNTNLSLPKNYSKIITYCFYLIASGSIATLLTDVDKFMLNFYLPMENIAIYTVSVFIATVIVVPYRSIFQIINPLISKLLHQNKTNELSDIYHQTTNNLYGIGSFIFLLIILNIKDLYFFIPQGYESGMRALYLIALVKLYDTLAGVSNAILFNSTYYKTALYLGFVLVISMIGFNMIFIPQWGITGTAFATFLAFLLYNSLKIYFVFRHDQLHPFSKEVARISLFTLIMLGVFHWIEFPFPPFINIFFKTIIISILTLFSGFYFKFSTQYVQLVRKLLHKK